MVSPTNYNAIVTTARQITTKSIVKGRLNQVEFLGENNASAFFGVGGSSSGYSGAAAQGCSKADILIQFEQLVKAELQGK